MSADLLERVSASSVAGLVGTLVMVMMMLLNGKSGTRHPQAVRYTIAVVMGVGASLPAWAITLAHATGPARQLFDRWWELPPIGWLIVIGYWCSLFAPLTMIITLIVIRARPAHHWSRIRT